ncbi:unnamed protein product, partial [Rotaria sp. Silwood2]
MRLSRMLMPL